MKKLEIQPNASSWWQEPHCAGFYLLPCGAFLCWQETRVRRQEPDIKPPGTLNAEYGHLI